jgi:hypothetical protein
MPAPGAGNAPLFSERLTVPRRWWLIATLGVAIGGAEVYAGFTWPVVLTVYAVLGVPTLVLMLGMSSGRVLVDAEGLHAGGRTLPLASIASARALDARETRHRLGPGADPAAHVFARGFIPESVLIRTSGDDPTPYWLVSTRHADRLLAALSRSGAVIG